MVVDGRVCERPIDSQALCSGADRQALGSPPRQPLTD